MISVSLIHGGPSPAFFTDAIADYIVYDTIKPHINSVLVPEVQEKLRKVSNFKIVLFVSNALKNVLVLLPYCLYFVYHNHFTLVKKCKDN